MTIAWMSFVLVVAVSLVAAAALVALFSLGLRLIDGTAPWRRPVAVALFVICAGIALVGIWLVVPFFH
ncbi:MAG: hypothetical protein ABIR17_04375 [Pseudolysinimonas sp.]|uniref:hypothetical protein n=1 Tax=Pseudolysinimonas sp. TaxID=2680009 RepID=UPI003267845F